MNTVWVRSSRGRYPIFVGHGLLAKSGVLLTASGLKGKVMIVTQKPVARFHLAAVLKSFRRKGIRSQIHFLSEGEKAKSEKELFRLLHALVKYSFERHDTVFALGGGVVGDLAGFAAAAYLRGISFVNAGTTLLAQVDSSIGGKTGINLREGKNLVGAFYPPNLVISDIGSLSTLPDREFRASLAEAVKYGIIRVPQLFDMFEKKSGSILARNRKLLTLLVTACARIKARVVSRDEREIKGERMILNYGHTFAHAFEQALRYKTLLHGEAVAIGMVCAAELAVLLGLLSPLEAQRQRQLLERLHLPVSLRGFHLRVRDVLFAMMRDKKKRGGALRFVLPVRMGRVVIREAIPIPLIRRVIFSAGGRS
jgi:3-dehydroquinate synthase